MYFTLNPYSEILAGMQTALAVNEGIIKLVGKPDSGKTALCAALSRALTAQGHEVVFFMSPPNSVEDLQQGILRHLQLPSSGNFTRQLTAHLLARAADAPTLVLIFDDAEHIDATTFTSIRMLCNIQSNTQALIRVIICGTQALNERLEATSFRALTQFLSQSFTLPAMTLEQATDFCAVYWQQTGMASDPLDSRKILELYKESAGLPGSLLDKLQGALPAEIQGSAQAGLSLAQPDKADNPAGPRTRRAVLLAVLLVFVCGGGALGLYFFNGTPAGEAPPRSSIRPVQPDTITAFADGAEQVLTAQTQQLDALPAPEAARVTAEPAVTETGSAEANDAMAQAAAFVGSWTQSWQTKDVDGFVAHYHRDFTTPYADSAAEWLEQRRLNIGNAGAISLSFDTLENHGGSPAVQTIRFWLRYRSATYSDDTQKELILQLQDGQWRIRSERNLEIIRL